MSGWCLSPLDNVRVESDCASLWVTLAGREKQSIAVAVSFILGRRGPGSWSRRLLVTAIYHLCLLNGRNLWAGTCCSRSLKGSLQHQQQFRQVQFIIVDHNNFWIIIYDRTLQSWNHVAPAEIILSESKAKWRLGSAVGSQLLQVPLFPNQEGLQQK